MNETNETARDDRDPPEDWEPMPLRVGPYICEESWVRGHHPDPPFMTATVREPEWRGTEMWNSTSVIAHGRSSIAVASALCALRILDGDLDDQIETVGPDGTRYLVARVDGDVRIEIRGAR